MTPEVNIVRGILPECFITYVSRRFPEVKEVRDPAASNEINYKLFEAVSDRIELGVAEVMLRSFCSGISPRGRYRLDLHMQARAFKMLNRAAKDIETAS